MPKKIEELLKFENKQEIEKDIIEYLTNFKEMGFTVSELEFNLMSKNKKWINLGGKFFLYNILKDLVEKNKINNIISMGKEYFFIESV